MCFHILEGLSVVVGFIRILTRANFLNIQPNESLFQIWTPFGTVSTG
jgi:hypothetical protein